MSLDILNPTIYKETQKKGGYCIVDESMIDDIYYFEIDDSVFGLDIQAINPDLRMAIKIPKNLPEV